jgi:hypothetical protein
MLALTKYYNTGRLQRRNDPSQGERMVPILSDVRARMAHEFAVQDSTNPYQQMARMIDDAIAAAGGGPVFFRAGPYSPKWVVKDTPGPANLVSSGREAVELMCTDERIRAALMGYAPAEKDNGSFYPLTFYVARPNPNINLDYEFRTFMTVCNGDLYYYISAYHAPTVATAGAPANTPEAIEVRDAIRDYIVRNQSELLTAMYRMAWCAAAHKANVPANVLNLINDYANPTVECNWTESFNLDLCVNLSLPNRPITLIELNELELTNASRYSEDEIRKAFTERAKAMSAPSKQADMKTGAGTTRFRNIIPGDTRVTELFLDSHASYLAKISARASALPSFAMPAAAAAAAASAAAAAAAAATATLPSDQSAPVQQRRSPSRN